MLNNITWQGYWATLAIISTAYYLFIYLLYFKKDFKISFPRNRSLIQQDVTTNASSFNADYLSQHDGLDESEESLFTSPEAASEEHTVYACMDELAAYYEEAKKEKCNKGELLYAVQRILSKYSSLKASQYRESITNVIISEAEHICSIHLSLEEVVSVWSDK